VHNLSTCFVLGYHGCDRETGERLLLNEPFHPQREQLRLARCRDLLLGSDPFVVGAVVDPGFCLDLISSNGIHAVEEAYASFQSVVAASGAQVPQNVGGDDLFFASSTVPSSIFSMLPGKADQDIDAFLEEIYSSR
jgi:hypothetical protein